MNVLELKKIINSGLPDALIISKIIEILATDEDVIITMMKILERERKTRQGIHDEMNLLLSQAHVCLDNKDLNKDGFLQDKITGFYANNQERVKHCFKDFNKRD